MVGSSNIVVVVLVGGLVEVVLVVLDYDVFYNFKIKGVGFKGLNIMLM